MHVSAFIFPQEPIMNEFMAVAFPASLGPPQAPRLLGMPPRTSTGQQQHLQARLAAIETQAMSEVHGTL
ncbi:hypothetical protein SQ11_11525 [Nitrosospira sp. NpAV]|nr:hypothetical protein SQ11_11525 [Nitrosospira sp. NpAV]